MSAVDVETQVPVKNATYLRSVHSEWIKVRSVRSIWILLVIAVALFVLIPWLVVGGFSPGDGQTSSVSAQAIQDLYAGAGFVTLIIAILSSMVITSEFSTGMARNTFTATPHRGYVLAAKATVVSLYALVIGIVGLGFAYLLFGSTLASSGGEIDFDDSETLRIFLVSELAFVVIALLALALGTLLRSSVGTIFTVVGLQLILPSILLIVSNDIANWIGAVLPTSAANAAMSVTPVPAGDIGLSATGGLIALVAWAVIPMLGALVVLKAKDI